MSYNGYTGFLGWAGQRCPTLKPGESYQDRGSKFSQMTKGMPSSIEVGDKGYQSETNLSFSQVQPKDYTTPDRRGVMAHRDEQLQSRPFLGKSLHHEQYRDFKGLTSAKNQHSMDAYERAFQAVLEGSNTQEIHKSDLSRLLTLAHGSPPTEYVLHVYQKRFENKETDTISWSEFQDCVQKTNDYFSSVGSSVGGKQVQPAWMTSNVPKKVLDSVTKESSHHIDYGQYGGKPLQRAYVRKTGMATTTVDMDVGTTRDSYHVPGYGGFIPQAPNNPVAVQQGDGQKSRNRGEDLRLYHRDNLPGYTGHKPDSCINYRGGMSTGVNTLTTNGSTFKPFK